MKIRFAEVHIREGEPGALHHGPDASCVGRHGRRRGNSVVTAMRKKLEAQGLRILVVMSALASYALVLEAGRRW
jgi:hypothetical protein